MKHNRFIVRVGGPGSISVMVGEKLKDLGAKTLAYKLRCWHVETDYSKEDLLENLKRVMADKAKVEVERF